MKIIQFFFEKKEKNGYWFDLDTNPSNWKAGHLHIVIYNRLEKELIPKNQVLYIQDLYKCLKHFS